MPKQPIDMTDTHLKTTIGEDGKKQYTIKPLRVERTVHADGHVDIKVFVPRLRIVPKTKTGV